MYNARTPLAALLLAVLAAPPSGERWCSWNGTLFKCFDSRATASDYGNIVTSYYVYHDYT